MVYILHFSQPLAHARHYVGYCAPGRLGERLAEHRSGNGARILRECNRKGITYQVAALIETGNRSLERKLKRAKNTRRFCPICKEAH